MVNRRKLTPVQRVLVLDDEPFYRERLRTDLCALGFEVVDTGDPSRALEYCEEFDFDLVVASVNVPSFGVATFLQLIRLRHRRVPIVVLSPFPSMENTATAFRYGTSQSLRKHEEAEALHRVLVRIVAGHDARPRAA